MKHNSHYYRSYDITSRNLDKSQAVFSMLRFQFPVYKTVGSHTHRPVNVKTRKNCVEAKELLNHKMGVSIAVVKIESNTT